MSMKDHAQMQYIHQRKISNALQSQSDAKQRQYDAMSGMDNRREGSRQRNYGGESFATDHKVGRSKYH